MPEVFARIRMTIFAEGRGGQKRFCLLLPGHSTISRENMHWLRAKLKQKSSEAQRQIRIAEDGKLLAVNVRA
jgi:hypothetical protein